jgi:hypothetical protein
LFLGLACLAARRTGFGRIVTLAENGQMALHLPLTAARCGPFSTHTAHPEFVNLAQRIFSRLLTYTFTFFNPFLYLTKAEVVQRLPQALRGAIPRSVSCWRASRLRGARSHCGQCVPCLVRRLALECVGIRLAEYQRDILAEDIAGLAEDDVGKGNVVDLLELVRHFTNIDAGDVPTLIERFPDLVNEDIDLAEAVGLYRRFAAEIQGVRGNYRSLQALLP